jgi:hypothetical protein
VDIGDDGYLQFSSKSNRGLSFACLNVTGRCGWVQPVKVLGHSKGSGSINTHGETMFAVPSGAQCTPSRLVPPRGFAARRCAVWRSRGCCHIVVRKCFAANSRKSVSNRLRCLMPTLRGFGSDTRSELKGISKSNSSDKLTPTRLPSRIWRPVPAMLCHYYRSALLLTSE